MSKLTELIEKLCPNGVEYHNLEDCCYILDNLRKPIRKSNRSNGKYPYYGANGIQDYVSDYIFDGTYVLVGEDGSVITKNGNPVVNWASGKIWVNNHAHIISEKNGVLLRFLFHYIQTLNVSFYIHGNIPKLTGKDFRILQIPTPPLEVQNEIVRILDKFTTLEDELKNELECRKQQYEYYRDKLLSFSDTDENVKWMTMGEIGTFIRGNGLQKKDFTEIGVPCIHYGQVYTYYGMFANETKSFVSEEAAKKFKKAKYGDVIIVCTSENVEDVCKCLVWLGDENVCVSGETYIFQHNQNPKYIAYYLQTSAFQAFKKRNYTGTKVIRVHEDRLKKFVIPIPPIEEQKRIVEILDRFEALTTDICNGLPAEIKARQQQYEYYRNKLLTFKEKTA